MSFINPAPMGGYLTGSLIDESEINYWCGVLPDCLDGANGGTYTLVAPLIINGDDVEIANLIATNLTVSGTFIIGGLNASGDVVLGDASADLLTVNAFAFFLAAAQFAGSVTVGTTSADTITVNATADFKSPVALGTTTADEITLRGLLQPSAATGGRVMQTGEYVNAAAQTVDGTLSRYVVIAYSSSTTTTINGTFVNGDMVSIFNSSSVSQVIAGTVFSGTIPTHQGVVYLKIAGVFRAVQRWTW